MAYYNDPDYQKDAREAILDLGTFFTSRFALRKALDLGRGAPGRWFDGALPSPGALVRIRGFLALAAEVEPLAQGDRKAVGRFFEHYDFKGRVFWDSAGEQQVLEKAKRYFRNGVPPRPPRSNWTQTLTEKHPELFLPPPGAHHPLAHEPKALADLLGEIVGQQ